MTIFKNKYRSLVDLWGKVPIAITLTLVLLISVVAIAIAAEYIIDPDNPTQVVNGAIFKHFVPTDASGTGVFDPFIRISANMEVVQGYNTDYRPLQFQEDKPWTESLRLSEVPMVLYEGVVYREFQLDINQINNDPKWFISLDEVQIWLGGSDAAEITGFVPGATPTDFGTFPGFILEEVYNLDAVEDNHVKLNYTYGAGSGKRNMKMLIPDENFGAYDDACVYLGEGCSQFVVFYTKFGMNFPNNDGFEEWGMEIYSIFKGYKYYDMNANGMWDEGEPGLEGWQICAEQAGMDPICVLTRADGSYVLPVPAGTWTISEVCPVEEEWFQSEPAPIDGVCGTGVYTRTIGKGTTIDGLNFGNYQGIPDIEIDKTGDELSKIGDLVDYTITVTNTSTPGTAPLECTVTDPLVGVDETFIIAWDDDPVVINVYDFEIPEDADDPFVNTATVVCTYVDGMVVVADDMDTHSINLFQPAIELTKTGDELSKIGDLVDYTITLTNLSSEDTPTLACTITDEMLDIDESFDIDWDDDPYVIQYLGFEIPEDADDPFVNTAYVECSPMGFPNILPDDATWEVNLFQPEIELTKTGDELSKIGDLVDYTITLTNLSSEDTPTMECTITDEMLDIDVTFYFDWDDEPYVINETDFEIPEDADDPFVNIAEVVCTFEDFPNVLEDEATWEVNLFQPEIELTKEAEQAYSKAGDYVDYTITLTNLSSDDTPNMYCTITDEMLDIDESFWFAWDDEPYVIEEIYLVLATDTDPLENTAEVVCTFADFPNVLEDEAIAEVTLIFPEFTLTKECVEEPVVPGENAEFEVVFTNTGDVPLVVVFDEGPYVDVPITVPVGGNSTFSVYVLADTDPAPSVVSNTVNAHVTLPEMYGLDNEWFPYASDTCDIYAVKSGYKWHDLSNDGIWDEGEPILPGWKIHFYAWDAVAMDWEATYVEVLTGFDGKYEFNMVMPGVTYAVCEVLEAGFVQTFPHTLGEGFVDCTVFGPEYGPIGYEIMLLSGEYEEDNDFGNYMPPGCTYTLGYWKTHSEHGPAGPADPTWLKLPYGPDTEFFNTGLSWLDLFWTPPAGGNAYIILAYQYMAAWLNINHVEHPANPAEVADTMALAEAMLDFYADDLFIPASGTEFSTNDRAFAISLASFLDMFNNGELGVPHCDYVD